MKTFICTFNCGKVPPLDEQFYSSVSAKWPQNPCDLYVFGFQELSSILDGTTPHLIEAIITEITNHLCESLADKYNVTFPFPLVHTTYFGAIGLILISPHRAGSVVTSKGHPVGHLWTNLKGGVGARVTLDHGPTVTFVCMHLNAGETQAAAARRSSDLYEILSSLRFTDTWCVHKPQTHTVILGDLNYRMTGGPDELTALRKSSITTVPTLTHFYEPQITFPPTYKLQRGTSDYLTNRVPSYCDRILFLDTGSDESSSDTNVEVYSSIKECLLSDHVPVYMIVTFPDTPPESPIDSNGILIHMDREHLFRNQYRNFYALTVSAVTTHILRCGLLLIHTRTGNTLLAILLGAILYRLKNWLL